jgi:hypothetical protein
MEVSRLTEGAVWYISVEQIPAEQIPAEQIPAEQIPAEQIPAEQSVVAAVLDIVAPSSRAMDARQGVVDALSARDGLLVLDACEGRLGEVAGDVEALLSACPGVRVLTTSRELLGLLDEALFPIGPLPEDDAIALLADRACLVAPTFTRAPGDEPSADRLCALVAVLEVVLPPVEAKPGGGRPAADRRLVPGDLRNLSHPRGLADGGVQMAWCGRSARSARCGR